MMKIYTKKGDTGETSLIGGKRVKKYNVRIEAYGTVDELNSFIGLIRDSATEKGPDGELREIQNRLFTVGAELATDPEKKKVKTPVLADADIEMLEKAMDRMDRELEPLRNFILPGGDITASHCHVARCVCRRAERIAGLLAGEEETDPRILSYLNRLSDYLFVLARFYTKRQNGEETLWKTRV